MDADCLELINYIKLCLRDMNGRTPLSWAAGEGHYERVKLLLGKNGIDLDSKDDLGQTSLWWATKNGHENIVRVFTANIKSMQRKLGQARSSTNSALRLIT
jgi:ankyrin repeat protein